MLLCLTSSALFAQSTICVCTLSYWHTAEFSCCVQILVELAELQDQEVGDGTTSVVIVAAEILKRANDLVRNKIHPTSIISGFRLAMREVCCHSSSACFQSQAFSTTTNVNTASPLVDCQVCCHYCCYISQACCCQTYGSTHCSLKARSFCGSRDYTCKLVMKLCVALQACKFIEEHLQVGHEAVCCIAGMQIHRRKPFYEGRELGKGDTDQLRKDSHVIQDCGSGK